jgi:hypothetical protein
MKPYYLIQNGHEVLNPALDDDDFFAVVRTALSRIREGRTRRDCRLVPWLGLIPAVDLDRVSPLAVRVTQVQRLTLG